MQTQLTSKGQLVIPKPIRDALGLAPGTRLEAEIIDGDILLRPTLPKTGNLDEWRPRNPGGNCLSTAALCEPVSLDRD